MQVLKSNRAFFKYFYLLNSEEDSSTWHNVKMWLLVPIDLFVVLPAMVYFVQNILNLLEATESMGVVTPFR